MVDLLLIYFSFLESGLFSCDDCSKSFNTFSEFIAHANLYHSGNNSEGYSYNLISAA